LRRAALAALVAVAAVAPAQAGPIVQATFSNVNPGEVVTIHDSLPQYAGANGVSGWAGVYNFVNASGYLTGSYGGFCIDINQDIYGGTTATWNVADLASAPVPGQNMGGLRSDLIRELWYNDYAKIGNSNSNAAAFQIAIWEIINETATNADGTLQLGMTGGTFSVSDSDTATLTTANQWLAGLDLHDNGPKYGGLIALENTTYQDYVTAVPAPPGLVLGGIALAGGALAAGWRRLRHRPARLAA
jgi:hypothetical protein